MKTPVTVLALVCSIAIAAAALPAGWSNDLAGALNAAGTNRQPVLVYFTASWCGPCKLMARTTLADETVVQALNRVRPVLLDVDEKRTEAGAYNVQSVPTFLMLSPGGDEVARESGYREAMVFIQFITNGVARTTALLARQQQFEDAIARVGRIAIDADPLAAKQAADELFELCAQPEKSIRQSAVNSLKALAAKHPGVVLDGLNHSRLAVRIEVSNVLRARLGDGFDVDPWSDAPLREMKIAAASRIPLSACTFCRRTARNSTPLSAFGN
ncbi:MAG: thioredoxin family protein [Verrucomicrobia bacterium]|nr:thioredoxin family protein [Verrucomicrobiota bacterium]